MALPLYAITLFVSAFILFMVQPIVGKIILPKLGGTPQVWNTCMVFFQMVLLAGYAYTHNASTRLTLRQQLTAHAVLLLLPLVVLLPFPFALGGVAVENGVAVEGGSSIWGFLPDLGSNPIPSTLKILFLYVALPFLVVATTAPLLQKWFVHTGHPAAKDPYFLYGASNLGSMLSLILYPIIIEPYIGVFNGGGFNQAWLYTGGYLLLIVLVMICAATVWASPDPVLRLKLAGDVKPEPAPAPPPSTTAAAPETGVTASAPTGGATGIKSGQPGKQAGKGGTRAAHGETSVALSTEDVTTGRRLRWILLAAIPSSLMLGITTHITTDLSPMPLFWLVPLILYLGSFILVFARWPVVWTEQPHTYFVYAQPIFLWLMVMADVMNLASDPKGIPLAIAFHVLGFFTTTMVCHGELAKDRPSTKHLTEFYLMMSVGGMLGGMFNALIAPVVFPKLWELPLAIFAAALARPRMFDTGLLDNWIASMLEGQPEAAAPKHGKGGARGHHAPATGMVTANESLVSTLDLVWPAVVLILALLLSLAFNRAVNSISDNNAYMAMSIMFGIPLLLACISFARPWRIGLGVGAVLLVYHIYQHQNDPNTRVASRSYFGAISVKEFNSEKGLYRQLIHGHIDHGMNFVLPSKEDRGKPDKDFSRLATTYYHREGPVGRVMEKFNWFPGPPNSNTYWADARMPASLFSSALLDFGTAVPLPMTTLVTAWSEPPLATIGLGTGTMASYGRLYQHVHFYEIDNQIRRLSLVVPTREITTWDQYADLKSKSVRQPWFNYLEQAIERGSTVQVLMGDARLRMALPYKNHYEDKTDHGGGPEKFYHMMVVDAFSSDAIPAHLLTKESFQMYFDHLAEEGVLCVHTSNRFVNLPKVVAAVSQEGIVEWQYNSKGEKEPKEWVKNERGEKEPKRTPLKYLRGHDSNDNRKEGHYTSEWVMVARKAEYLGFLSAQTKFLEEYQAAVGKKTSERYWSNVVPEQRYLWTDDHYNLLSVIRW